MRREVVERRGWLDDRRFLDLMGITSLIPGPNSTELALLLGRLRAGGAGLVVAGLAFIGPALLIVLALAWAYVAYGATPQAEGLLYGAKPVVIAIVAVAVWQLARHAAARPLPLGVALSALVLSLLGVSELLVLAGGALAVAVVRLAPPIGAGSRVALLPIGVAGLADGALGRLDELVWTMLKIGAVLYGSGYVLLAFLRGDFVERLGWLSSEQLLDAVAVGQITPGPLFSTATFVGYLVAGLPGALVASVAIFLPSFCFVAIVAPLADRLRDRRSTAALLDGVTAAALGLMAAVTVQLARDALVDVPTALLGAATLVLLLRSSVASAWLITAGGLIGLLLASVRI